MHEIRLAIEEDISQILPLMEQLGYPQNLTELKKHFEIFTKQEGYGVAVAKNNEVVIGWVAWSRSLLFVNSKMRIHIEGLIVSNEYRGQGIGKKLMNFVENIAKANSPCIIDLTSGLRRANDGTHEFYKSLDYHNEGEMAKMYLRKEV